MKQESNNRLLIPKSGVCTSHPKKVFKIQFSTEKYLSSPLIVSSKQESWVSLLFTYCYTLGVWCLVVQFLSFRLSSKVAWEPDNWLIRLNWQLFAEILYHKRGALSLRWLSIKIPFSSFFSFNSKFSKKKILLCWLYWMERNKIGYLDNIFVTASTE